jgi:hypothetical protein
MAHMRSQMRRTLFIILGVNTEGGVNKWQQIILVDNRRSTVRINKSIKYQAREFS